MRDYGPSRMLDWPMLTGLETTGPVTRIGDVKRHQSDSADAMNQRIDDAPWTNPSRRSVYASFARPCTRETPSYFGLAVGFLWFSPPRLLLRVLRIKVPEFARASIEGAASVLILIRGYERSSTRHRNATFRSACLQGLERFLTSTPDCSVFSGQPW